VDDRWIALHRGMGVEPHPRRRFWNDDHGRFALGGSVLSARWKPERTRWIEDLVIRDRADDERVLH
jgi:hypothetical protein